MSSDDTPAPAVDVETTEEKDVFGNASPASAEDEPTSPDFGGSESKEETEAQSPAQDQWNTIGQDEGRDPAPAVDSQNDYWCPEHNGQPVEHGNPSSSVAGSVAQFSQTGDDSREVSPLFSVGLRRRV